MQTFLETYFNIFYILGVVLASEIFNEYVPWFKKIPSRWTALVVSVIMLGIFYLFENPVNDGQYALKTFISFMAAVVFYDYILKPVKNMLQKKFGKLGEDEDPEETLS